MTSIYTLTIFTSAFLLFLIQPMISKLLLPYLGGSPAVWNTSMMFFQSLLLLGYAYAHISAKRLGARKQYWLHLALLGISLAWLPIAAKTDLGFLSVDHPIRWVLLSLFLSVGFPFFVLAANAPLLQFWLSRTRHKDAANPYFLYSASNIGSLLALLGYPFVIEPLLALPQQTMLWSWLFFAFVMLLVLCGRHMQKHLTTANEQGMQTEMLTEGHDHDSPPTWKMRLYWVALSFCPSSLLLGVTTYVTTDIASVPLLWVIPLALYLLSFIMAFARKPLLVDRAIKAQAVLIPFVVMAMAFKFNLMSQVMILHLFAFFYIALSCHGLLARHKPSVAHLTEFFLIVSFGGMLGGVFNSLVAPLIFTNPIEYPLVLVLSLFLRPPEGVFSRAKRERFFDIALPLDFAIFLWVAFYGYNMMEETHAGLLASANAWLASLLPGSDNSMVGLSVLSLLAVALFILFFIVSVINSKRPVRFALTMAALLIVTRLAGGAPGSEIMQNVIYAERNFFGVNRVLHSSEAKAMMLMHGTTLHGIQSLEPGLRLEPVSYYGPLKTVFAHLDPRIQNDPVAVLGLGAGSLACFGKEGQPVDFFEIDPAVADIAYNPRFFTFLSQCGADTRVIMGDGRLTLDKMPDDHYGVIVVDVFTSDAIPVHLLTRQALDVYKRHLKAHGMLMFNISNRHLRLAPEMAALAAGTGMKALINYNMTPTGKLSKPSIWVLMASDERDFSRLQRESTGWKALEPDNSVSIWTDSYSNILQTLF